MAKNSHFLKVAIFSHFGPKTWDPKGNFGANFASNWSKILQNAYFRKIATAILRHVSVFRWNVGVYAKLQIAILRQRLIRAKNLKVFKNL